MDSINTEVYTVNTDKLQTYLGMAKGVLIATIDYVANLTPEGLNWKSPIFWVGMGYAMVEAIKGYYAKGV